MNTKIDLEHVGGLTDKNIPRGQKKSKVTALLKNISPPPRVGPGKVINRINFSNPQIKSITHNPKVGSTKSVNRVRFVNTPGAQKSVRIGGLKV